MLGWSVYLFCGASFSLLLWVLLQRPLMDLPHWQAEGSQPLRYLAYLWLALLGGLALQLIPLPANWVQTLSPARWAIVAPYGADWLPLSATPVETFQYWMLSAAYGAFFWVALHALSDRRRLRLFLWAVVINAVISTVYGVLVLLGGAAFEPIALLNTNNRVLSGPFVGRNNFAGFLALSASLGIGLLLAEMRPSGERTWREWLRDTLRLLLSRKVTLRLMIVILVAGLVLTRSRMGNTAFLSATCVAGFLWFLRSGGSRRLALILFVSFILVDVYIIGSVVGLDRVVERIQATETQSELRVDINADALEYGADYWAWGSGADSFDQVFPVYKSVYGSGLINQAHNEYLQFILELGVVLGVLTLAIGAFSAWQGGQALWRRKSRFYRSVALGSVMAFVYLAIHSTADFNLRIPANAALFVAIMALMWRARYTPSKGSRTGSSL
ncbi:O-antigen polymerase, putative [gamma proteobacterium HTCC5015]|nr:O-antigen polymerase, putative [gamma proteobacterium HTCC5015]